jgi:hypothetical protein
MSEQKTKPTIHFVEVEIKARNGDFPGQTTKGAFTFEDSTVVICHPVTGEPARDPSGKTYSFKLSAPTNTIEDARIHAKRLTKDFRRALHGDRPRGFGGPGGSHRGPIRYPKGGYY